MRLEVVLDDVIVRAVNVIIIAYLLGWGAQLEVALDDVRCNCESGEVSIVAYLLGGGGVRVEVALDDVIVRAANVIILHTCSCSPSGMGCTALDDVIVRVEKFP